MTIFCTGGKCSIIVQYGGYNKLIDSVRLSNSIGEIGVTTAQRRWSGETAGLRRIEYERFGWRGWSNRTTPWIEMAHIRFGVDGRLALAKRTNHGRLTDG